MFVVRNVQGLALDVTHRVPNVYRVSLPRTDLASINFPVSLFQPAEMAKPLVKR